MRPRIFTSAILALTVASFVLQSSEVNAESRREREKPKVRQIVRTSYDPAVEKVDLFEGMKEGQFEAKVIAHGPKHGFIVVGNTTDQPLTVEMPQSFVVVPTAILKQFGGGFGGQQGGGFGGQQGGGLGQGGGQQQNAGGGLGGGQQGGGFGGAQQGGGQGQGFFSIPPEKAVKLSYVSACLNHGKADPHPRNNYSIIPVDSYTKDPVLKELISMVGTGQLHPQAAQAAIWHKTDNMSPQQLAAKYSYNAIGQKAPYFSQQDLLGANQILATAMGRIRERGENPVADTTPVRAPIR